MRSLAFALLLLVGPTFASGQKSVRTVDFKNFIYPLGSNLVGHAQLQWLDNSPGPVNNHPIHLVDGKDANGEFVFTLQSVSYAAVAGDAHEDAIVTVRYNAGSNQTTNYIYVYSMVANAPKLLGLCRSGDHGYSALQSVYGDKGQLVIDQIDPKRPGDASPATVLRTRFEWKAGHFQQAGQPEHAQPKAP